MKVITHRRKLGYFKVTSIYIQVAYCGFKWSLVYEDSDTWNMMPFSEEPTCTDCKEAYAMDMLGELP